jgi:hypothetical protein
MDVSALAVAAAYDAYLPVGACTVEAVVRVGAADAGGPGADVSLRLWTPLGATVAALREVAPACRDLCDGAIRLDDRTVEYPAGRSTDGAREYELAVIVPARRAGDELLAARFGVVVGGKLVARAPIAVTWIDDERLIAASADTAARPAVSVADLPTGPSPQPRHTLADDLAAGGPCPRCGLRSANGDRFCEGCGRELAAGWRP